MTLRCIARIIGVLLVLGTARAQSPLVLESLTTSATYGPESYGKSRLAANRRGQAVWLRQPGGGSLELFGYGIGGTLVWQTPFEPAPKEGFHDPRVAMDDEGAVILSGVRLFIDKFEPAEIVLYKYDPAGQFLWRWSTASSDVNVFPVIASVRLDSSGNILVAGSLNDRFL